MLLQINYSDGSKTKLEYDKDYHQTAEIDRLGRRESYEYDALGQRTKVIHADGSTRLFSYDVLGRLVAETDERGNVTKKEYDEAGRLVKTTNALGEVTTNVYDKANQLISVTDASGATTSYVYDKEGRTIKVLNPDGTFTEASYDADGRELSSKNALGFATSQEYDALGRLVKDIDELGHFVSFIYDEVGNRIKEVDADGDVTLLDYDNAGQLIKRTSPLGAVEGFQYDAEGNLVGLTDPNGRVTRYNYDSENRRVQVTDALGGIVTYAYDAVGNQLSVKDPLAQVTTYTYDARNRVTAMKDPLGESVLYSYDLGGNLASQTDRNGRVKEYSYDALNRVVKEVWKEGANSVRTKKFSYNILGVKSSESDEFSAYSYSYDSRGRLTKVDNAGTPNIPHLVLTKTYDAEENVLSTKDNFGVGVNSVYDPRGELNSRLWAGGGIDDTRLDFLYEKSGVLSAVKRFDDLLATISAGSSSYQYDKNKRISGLLHSNSSSSALAEYSYEYSPAGELLKESHHGTNSDYVYDALGQLVKADYSNQADENYTYDAAGNRKGASIVVGTGNRILADETADYTYDAEGNLISKKVKASGELTTYAYNHDNALISVVKKDAGGTLISASEYIYDVNGQRIGKVVDGVTTYTAYDDDAAWVDFADDGKVLTRFLHGDEADEVFGRYRSGEGLEYYLADRLYSVRDRATAKGLVTNHVDYSAFGKVVAETGAGDRFKFTGREYDAESEIYHYRARAFDPGLGRFMQQDPLGFGAGDVNLYRYVGNSPTNGRDPSGEMAIANTSVLALRGPAMAVATQASSATVRRHLVLAAVRGKLTEAGERIAAERVARGVLEAGYVRATTGRFGHPAAKGFVTALGAIGAIIALKGDGQGVEVTKGPNGKEIRRFEKQLDAATKVEAEEETQECDYNDPQPLILSWHKLEQHSDPTCLIWSEPNPKSCFFSYSQGKYLILMAWYGGVPSYRDKDEVRKKWCLRPDRVIGYQYAGPDRKREERHCVEVVVSRRKCTYHGWPSEP